MSEATTQVQLPEYRSHKVVQAAAIISMQPGQDGMGTINLEGDIAFPVTSETAQRILAMADSVQSRINEGVLVVYTDGYISWSPADVFEDGYSPFVEAPPEPEVRYTELTFSEALEFAKKGMYVEIQVPDADSKMQRPYLYMSPVGGDLVPWVASQTDLLASDWEISDVEDA